MRVNIKRSSLVLATLTSCVALGLLATPAGAQPLPPAPTVTPNPVTVGATITVKGTNCESSTNPVFAAAAILDSHGDPIVENGEDGSDFTAGAWTITLTVPAATPAGDYTVASFCDVYTSGFDYPDVPLTIKAAPVTPKASANTSTVSAGGTVDITGSGFVPGESVTVVLHSTPVQLAVLTANVSGAVSGTVTIPSTTAAGAHQLVLTGVTSGRSATIALAVTDPAALANTGTPDRTTLWIALSLIAGGGVAVAGARRRQLATTS